MVYKHVTLVPIHCDFFVERLCVGIVPPPLTRGSFADPARAAKARRLPPPSAPRGGGLKPKQTVVAGLYPVNSHRLTVTSRPLTANSPNRPQSNVYDELVAFKRSSRRKENAPSPSCESEAVCLLVYCTQESYCTQRGRLFALYSQHRNKQTHIQSVKLTRCVCNVGYV